MTKKELETAKPKLKSTLSFFNEKLTYLNDKRLLLNPNKGLAQYLAKSKKNVRDLTPLDTTLGIMSFSLYLLRLQTNIGLLMHLLLAEKKNSKILRELGYRILNDCLWAVVNLTQFFWLSYRKSVFAGFLGLQLEILAKFIDIVVIMIRYQQEKQEYELKYSQATDIERARLAIEWQNKELNNLRSLLTGLSIVLVFGLFSFSIITVPISPIVTAIILVSSLSRVLIDIEKDRQLIYQLKLKGANPKQLKSEKLAMTKGRMQNLNKIIMNSVFLPLGIFLLITTPIPVAIIVCLSMLLVYSLINHLININFQADNSASLGKKVNQFG